MQIPFVNSAIAFLKTVRKTARFQNLLLLMLLKALKWNILSEVAALLFLYLLSCIQKKIDLFLFFIISFNYSFWK